MKHTTVTSTQPIAYLPTSLIDFLHFLTTTPSTTSSTLIIICTSQSSFLYDLSVSLHTHTQHHCPHTDLNPQSHPLLERTLRILLATSRVKLAFCPSPAALHAYLAALPLRPTIPSSASPPITGTRREADPPVLALLNIVRLHRATAAYSAQGLSKALAAAVEVAWEMERRLVLFEYAEGAEGAEAPGMGFKGKARRGSMDVDEDADVSVARGVRLLETNREAGVRMELETGEVGEGRVDTSTDATRESEATQQMENVWTEQVPILDATTKTFGNFGDRGWMGRTVSVADVAARWCSFAEVPVSGWT